MSSYFLTPKASTDISQIWLHIAKDSVPAADRVETAILENCKLLGSMKSVGRRRPDLTKKQVLVWPTKPYSNYLIVYDPTHTPLRVVRVIHAARRKVWKRGV